MKVAESDISESFQFLVSQSVNGIVLNKPDKDGSAPQIESRVNNQQVVFQWEGFALTATTDSFGEFSVLLPRGAFVHATVERMIGAGGFLAFCSPALPEEFSSGSLRRFPRAPWVFRVFGALIFRGD